MGREFFSTTFSNSAFGIWHRVVFERVITIQDMFKGCFYQSGSRPRRDPDSLMLINSETKDMDVLTSIPFGNLLKYSRKRL